MSTNTESTSSRIADEVATVMSEAQEMLHQAANETGDKARDLRSKVETKLLQAKLKLQDLEGRAVERAKHAAKATDNYVRDHPWQAIGIAAMLGFAIGLLMNRR